MANPWSSSVEDVALQPLRKFLENDHRVTSVALAEQKLDNDPNDLITKMRLADKLTEEFLGSGNDISHTSLSTEALLSTELAKALSAQLESIYGYMEKFDDQDTLKLALLDAIKSCSAHREELSVVNRAKLIECLRTAMELIPKLYKKANMVPNEHNLTILTTAFDVLQSNDEVSHEDLYGYLTACTILLDGLQR